MFVAAATGLALAPIRMMQNPVEKWSFSIFLAYVALLSFTAAFYGVRVLKQKSRKGPQTALLDYVPPVLLLTATGAIALYGLSIKFMLAVYFAPVGLLVSIPLLRSLRSTPASKSWWLVEHLSAMLVSTIATLTAFLVTNAGRFLGASTSPMVWLVPTLVGIPFLRYMKRKYQTPEVLPAPAHSPPNLST